MTIVIWAIFFVPLSIFCRGLVLSYLWAWFLVPLGFNEISIAHALGLALFLLACQDQPQIKADPEKRLEDLTLHIVVITCVFLFMGLLVKHFM